MFIILSKEKGTNPSIELSAEQIKKLIQEVTESKESRKLALNLVRNAF